MHTLNQQLEYVKLYHGSTGIKGDKIVIQEKHDNSFTLGNGFYTTVNPDAAKLFSHLALVNDIIGNFEKVLDDLYEKQEKAPWTIGEIYEIQLENASVLDASSEVDPEKMMQLLLKSGYRQDYINDFSEGRLSNFDFMLCMVKHSGSFSGNIYEYMTRTLGYDALRVKEKEWKTFKGYPIDLGLDKEKFKEIPDTIVIYNAAKIKSFKEIQVLTKVKKIEEKRQRPKKRGLRR